MNTKKRLNCYVFSNLIVSFLALNVLTNNTTTELIKKTSSNTLNKIYEDEMVVPTVSTPDVILGSTDETNVITISNKTLKSENRVEGNISYVKPSYNSLTGTNLVNYAKNFLGLRYVSAGNSLSTGTDCSGFTKLIYQQFGITLGRTVSSQIYNGTYVSKNDLQPGDLVFYSYGSIASHVAIYMGNGLIIHESNPRDGVKISSVNIMNYITARRLITANVTSNDSSTVITNEPKVEVTPSTVSDNQNNTSNNVEVKVEEKKDNQEVVKEEIKEDVNNNVDSSKDLVENKEEIVDIEPIIKDKEANKEGTKEEIKETTNETKTEVESTTNTDIEVKEKIESSN